MSVRTLWRVLAGAGVLLALAVAGLGWWLSGYVASDAFHQRLHEAVRKATGQEASWTALDVGLFPPSVRVEQARLGDGSALAVEHAALRIAWWPLLARAFVVDRVTIDGGVLHGVRTASGMAWPWTAPSAAGTERGAAGTPAPDENAAARDGGRSFRFAVRRLDLEDSEVVITDPTVDPPARVALRELRGRARLREGRTLSFELDGRVDGGTLRAVGEVAAAGTLAATITFAAIPAPLFAPYLRDDARLGGTLAGTIALRGPARAPDAADIDLHLGDADFEIGDARVNGPVSLHAELRGALARPSGRFSLDAADAELRYGGVFRKPPGAAASAEGHLRTDPDGRVHTEEVRIRIRNLGGQGRLEWGGDRPLSAAFDAPAFAVDGWGALVPALAPLAPEGQLAWSDGHVAGSPPTVTGRAELDAVRLHPGGRGPIELHGALLADGDTLRSEDLVAHVAGQPVALALTLTELGVSARHQTQIVIDEADARPLLAALTGKPDALEGPVTLRAQLAGPVAAAAALDGLEGSIDLAAGPGRLPGIAPFRMALAQLESLIGGLSDRRRARLEPFLGERFESLTGHVEIADGVAHSDDLVLRYPGYALEANGRVRLADRGLDAQGRLVLEEAAYAALAGAEADPAGPLRVLPLAQIDGTLDAPRVAIDAQAALALAATFATAGKRDKVEREIDKVLGKGAGRDVLDALDGLFAPRRERR